MATTSEQTERLAVRAGEAAKILGISRRTLWLRTADGTIPSARVGGCTLYPIEALREWLRAQTNGVRR